MSDRVVTYRGHEITRVVTGHAYAANGNLYNPTPRIAWLVDKVPSSTLREAKALVDMLVDGWDEDMTEPEGESFDEYMTEKHGKPEWA